MPSGLLLLLIFIIELDADSSISSSEKFSVFKGILSNSESKFECDLLKLVARMGSLVYIHEGGYFLKFKFSNFFFFS